MSDYEQELEQQLNELQDRLTTSERLLEYLYPVWETQKDLVNDGSLLWMLRIGFVNFIRIQQQDRSMPLDEEQLFDVTYLYIDKKETVGKIKLDDLKKDHMEKFMLGMINNYVKRKEYADGVR
jgi:hypothetical protein